MSEVSRGNISLSRVALAGRFAVIAAVCVLPLLPLMPVDYFYHQAAIYGYRRALLPGIHWRLGLLVPIVAVSAFGSAWVWTFRGGRQVYFSPWRGLLCALLTFFYAAVFVSFVGQWLSDETLPFFRLAVVGLLFLPYLWLIPVVGAVAGIVLARGIAPEPRTFRARLRRGAVPLLVSVGPLTAILVITRCFPPDLP